MEHCLIITVGVKDEQGNWHAPHPARAKCVPLVIPIFDFYQDTVLAKMVRTAALELEKLQATAIPEDK